MCKGSGMFVQNVPGMFEEQQGDQCPWSEVARWEGLRPWTELGSQVK